MSKSLVAQIWGKNVGRGVMCLLFGPLFHLSFLFLHSCKWLFVLPNGYGLPYEKFHRTTWDFIRCSTDIRERRRSLTVAGDVGEGTSDFCDITASRSFPAPLQIVLVEPLGVRAGYGGRRVL